MQDRHRFTWVPRLRHRAQDVNVVSDDVFPTCKLSLMKGMMRVHENAGIRGGEACGWSLRREMSQGAPYPCGGQAPPGAGLPVLRSLILAWFEKPAVTRLKQQQVTLLFLEASSSFRYHQRCCTFKCKRHNMASEAHVPLPGAGDRHRPALGSVTPPLPWGQSGPEAPRAGT